MFFVRPAVIDADRCVEVQVVWATPLLTVAAYCPVPSAPLPAPAGCTHGHSQNHGCRQVFSSTNVDNGRFVPGHLRFGQVRHEVREARGGGGGG